jgi:S-DNA-T family DNA segregation ATPase FtsK/SpoIIIE
MIIATGKPDSLRQSYGHWTGVVRRSRLGIVTSASSDLDGDLLGAMLPRRLPIPARAGLVWMVADGEAVLAQVAADLPDCLPVFARD